MEVKRWKMESDLVFFFVFGEEREGGGDKMSRVSGLICVRITAYFMVLVAALHCTADLTASKSDLVIRNPCLLFSALNDSVVGAQPPECCETKSRSLTLPSSRTSNLIHLGIATVL